MMDHGQNNWSVLDDVDLSHSVLLRTIEYNYNITKQLKAF